MSNQLRSLDMAKLGGLVDQAEQRGFVVVRAEVYLLTTGTIHNISIIAPYYICLRGEYERLQDKIANLPAVAAALPARERRAS